MPVIITFRRNQKLMEAMVTPTMVSMIRSIFDIDSPCVEQHFSYPDTPYGIDQARRHWQSLSDEMRDTVRKDFVSCMINPWDEPNKAEYLLNRDHDQPEETLIDVGDCHLPSEP